MSIFPTNMMNKSELTCETIAGKLATFYEQAHLTHLQTSSYAEHMALGEFYECIAEFKDSVLEKIMGYKGMRIGVYSIDPLKPYTPGLAKTIVEEVKVFAEELCTFAQKNAMPDVEGMSEVLSGKAAKTLYLLTLR